MGELRGCLILKGGGVWLVAIVRPRVLVRMLSRPIGAWHGMATVEFSRDGTEDHDLFLVDGVLDGIYLRLLES